MSVKALSKKQAALVKAIAKASKNGPVTDAVKIKKIGDKLGYKSPAKFDDAIAELHVYVMGTAAGGLSMTDIGTHVAANL